MSAFPNTIKMFLVTVTVLPQKEGIDLPRFIQKLAYLLADYSTATRVVYKFKVSGESKILSVIQVSNIIGFERTIGGLWRIGAVEVDCQPIINFENFARNINVPDNLTKILNVPLAKEGLYWLEFDIDFHGKTTDEFIEIWRKEADAMLTARNKDGTSLEIYKSVAQRQVHVFINAADPEQVDLLSVQLPLMQDNGANVQIKCRALQFLEEYTTRITNESV